jgi:hypothetical protein
MGESLPQSDAAGAGAARGASAARAPGIARSTRIGIVVGIAVALALAALLLPAQPQPAGYHGFADARTIFGIPNFWNVASNLAFLAVGIAGLRFLFADPRRASAFGDPAERLPYAVLFAGVALTCAGSAYYHWSPDSARLAWDRLPMTIGFMSLVAAIVAERIDAKAGRLLLAPMVVAGIASVLWWRASAALGAEDVIPYAAVQYGSIAIVLLVAALFPSRYTRPGDLYWSFALYVAAKVAELLDGWIYAQGGLLSGHTLKHLLAAAAVYMILRMVAARRVV